MRKLKLDIDALQVDSFPVNTLPTPSGTVNAQEFEPNYSEVPSPSLEACYPGAGGGGGAYTAGTCIGPTFCCPPTWRPTCRTCDGWTCQRSCQPGPSCTDDCTNCSF